MTIDELIEYVYSKNSTDDLLLKYKGGGVLQQLLCIERSLDYYINFKNEIIKNDKDYKRIPKGNQNNKEANVNSFKLERMRLEKERENARKLEKEQKLRLQSQGKKTRPDMGRTFIPEQEVEVKVETVDKNSEYLKYFT